MAFGGYGYYHGYNAGFGVSGGSEPGIIPGMMDVYNQTLALNQQNYQNVLNTYATGSNLLSSSLPSIYSGYENQLAGIRQTLGIGGPSGGSWGVAAPAAEAIKQSFAQQRGATDQQLINAGLGNTTVRGNLQNQNTLYAGQAYGNLGAQLAQTYAGYQSQYGLAEQAAKLQGLGMQSQLAQAEGSTLGNYRFANTAGQLTGQYSQNPGYGGGGGGGGGGYGATNMGGAMPHIDSMFNKPAAYGNTWGEGDFNTYGGGMMGSQTAGGGGWGAYTGAGSPYAGYTGGMGEISGWGDVQGAYEGTGE